MRALFLRSALIAGVAVAMVAVAPNAFATLIFKTTFAGTNEAPPTPSLGTGSATVTVSGTLLDVSLSFSGLTAPAAAAHIHCCTTPGNNVGVAVPFTGFPAATSGTYANSFDLTLGGTYTASFLTGAGGTASSAAAVLLAGLEAGEAYINIHDANFPGGEIRGFLTAVAAAAPEPSSLWLLGFAAFAGIGASRRYLRK